LQAEMYAPHTEHLFRLAGISPGMTVVDVGCGPGDVTRLLARMVGPSGFVTGIDVPPLPLARQCLDWLTAAVLAGGREPDFGDRLPAILRAAGFPAPQVAATVPTGGPESLNYAHLAAGVAVLLPLIEASGAARRDNVAIETLLSRLREEALAAAATLYSAELIGAWVQTRSASATSPLTTCRWRMPSTGTRSSAIRRRAASRSCSSPEREPACLRVGATVRSGSFLSNGPWFHRSGDFPVGLLVAQAGE
jgi:SAM-dependent methyltransferase